MNWAIFLNDGFARLQTQRGRHRERSLLSDNGAELIANSVKHRFGRVGVRRSTSQRDHHENCHDESYDGPLRDELVDGEVFHC